MSYQKFLQNDNFLIFGSIYLYLLIYFLNIFAFLLLNLKFSYFSKNFKTISYFLYVDNFLKFFFFTNSLFLLGIPPFSGFILKFLLTIIILLKKNIFFFIFFFMYVILSIFFYLKLVKINLSQKPDKFMLKKILKSRIHNSYFNIFLLFLLLFFNFFFIFFFKDFLLVFFIF